MNKDNFCIFKPVKQHFQYKVQYKADSPIRCILFDLKLKTDVSGMIFCGERETLKP